MATKLPLVMPPSATYQGAAFILGIILATPNIANEYYNNYIDLVCNNTEQMNELELEFARVTWEDFRLNGIAEMNLFHLKNIERDKFIGFINERIDQNNYILLYEIDEYYLSYSEYYHKDHFIHDTYIYGYDADSFYIMAYKEKKLTMQEVAKDEIVEGIYSYYNFGHDESFCTFRPCHSVAKAIDTNKIISSIKEYLGNKKESCDEKVYGLETYGVIQKCILNIYKNSKDDVCEELDIRVMRLLWEHKKVLNDHIQKLQEYIKTNNKITEKFVDLENISHDIFLMAIKYNLTHRKRILKTIIEALDILKDREKEYLLQVVQTYNNTLAHDV